MSKNPLLDKMMKAGKVKLSTVLKDSVFVQSQEVIKTDLPILNIAFSGSVDGGLTSGVTVFAGQSKSFKTCLGLYCLKAYFDKYPDAICLFYDDEFGSPASYFEMFGIDTERVVQIPVMNTEDLKFDIVSRLNEIERGEKVFILIDSLGNLASKREYDNAVNENSAKDMSRAADIKGIMRVITPYIAVKDIPCIVINHVYSNVGGYGPSTAIAGGSGIAYAANTTFEISRAKIADGKDLSGYKYSITVRKSRSVKEESKLPFEVYFSGGIYKYSGLFDLAVECGFIHASGSGWYNKVDENGVVDEKKYRQKELDTPEFWDATLKSDRFNKFIEDKYKLSLSNPVVEEPESVEDVVVKKEKKKKLLAE